jgi:hypothetical protein
MTVNRRTKKVSTRPGGPTGSPDQAVRPATLAEEALTEEVNPVMTQDSESVKPESVKSESAKPETAKPETAKPETAKPETAKPAKAAAKPAAKSSIARQTPSSSIWNSPVMTSQIEVVGTLQMAGQRPVTASNMAIFGTILNGRPIEASNLKLYDQTGSSPIFLSDFHAVEGLDLPGGRPVMASSAGLMAAMTLTGGRPVFSNEADDAGDMMGYID